MADRSIRIVLNANVQGLLNGFRTASTAAGNLNTRIMQNEQTVRGMTTGLGLMGAAAVAGVGLAVKAYSDFDASMSAVKATGAATAYQLEDLRDAAMDAGRETAYSATEAAGGIENLLKAGVAAEDVINGGLTGALDLAAAGELEVADAAEIAATAMTQFNLSGSDMSHVADLLAAGAGKAQGDVSDLAQALKQGGLVAAQTGLSIEETTGTLSAFAAAGLLGSDAGTSFKTMLQRLSAPSGEAANLMKELGINAYDASGEFVGMEALAGQLTTAFGDMTPAQRNAAMATIFGADAVRAASVVYSNGESGIRDWISAVDDQGYASQVAADRLDNLQGDLKIFAGSFETALIGLGESGDGPLRQLVQGATDAVNAFSDLPDGVQGALLSITGGAGIVALGVAGMGKLVLSINNARTAMQSLGITARGAGIAAGVAGGAIALAAVGLSVWASNAAEAKAKTIEYKDTLDDAGGRTEDTVRRINEALSADTNNWLDNLFGDDPRSLIDIGEQIGVTIEDLQGYILGEAEAMERVTAAAEAYVGQSDEVQTKSDIRKAASNLITGALDKEAESLTDAERAAAQKAEADGVAGVAADGLSSSTESATSAVEAQTEALEESYQAMMDASGIVLSLRDAQRNLEQSIDDAKTSVDENGKTLDINTEKGRKNQAALDDVASSALDVADSMRESGDSAKSIQGAMETSRTKFINLATSMGMSSGEAEALADDLGLIPGNYNAKVTVESRQANEAARTVKANLDKIQSKSVTLTVKKHNLTIEETIIRNSGVTSGGRGRTTKYATGGAVRGPGSSTSDSIPARLSNGEHVLTAAEVRAAGGHGAVYALRDALKSGRGFAGGGPVTAVPYAYTPTPTAPTSPTLSLDGVRVTLDIAGQPIEAVMRQVADGRVRTAQRDQRAAMRAGVR